MKKLLFSLATILPMCLFGQSLSQERVSKLKSSVVRVFIDSSPSGTGFFANAQGQVVTCWHVIATAFNQQGQLVKKISIEFQSGERQEVGIATVLLQKGNAAAVGNDYCILNPLDKITAPFTFLTIGNFDRANEGDEIYTCGYPFGMSQQFLSKGIISTKFIDTSNSIITATVKKSRCLGAKR